MIACNQVLYHLRERAIEHAVLDACKRHDMALVAYSPFGSGDFPLPGDADGAVLAEMAGSCGATLRQVALAWLLRDESVFVIPKTSTPERCRENAEAATRELDPLQLERIEAAFPLGRARRGLPMI